MTAVFNDQPTLDSVLWHLRPLHAEDMVPLTRAAADPAIWAGHPARDRHKRHVFERYVQSLLQMGGTLVIIDKGEDKICGCTRFYVSPDQPTAISIGFTFLETAYWGGRTNRHIKKMMLDHAFASFDRVWFHIDPTNLRSRRATAKLGARDQGLAELDLGTGRATWTCYSLDRADWQAGLVKPDIAPTSSP